MVTGIWSVAGGDGLSMGTNSGQSSSSSITLLSMPAGDNVDVV